MGPRGRALLQIGVLVAVLVALGLLFPRVLAFVERGARELRYFWWAILLALLGVWLVWGVGRKQKG
jgi:hypothetical protein